MPEEPKVTETKPNEGNPPPEPQPNPAPSSEETIKKLQEDLKSRDTQIQDLQTTVSTIEQRFNQVNQKTNANPTQGNQDIQERAKRIMANAAYDPDGAATELSSLLSEMHTKASSEAVQKVQQNMQTQNFFEKLRNGVKSANPEFDDEVTDLVMNHAESLAASGKFRDAQSAVNEATKYVKSKLDAYASKKNAVPPLPAGAGGEHGGNPPPAKPTQEKIPTDEEEFESRRVANSRKVL